MPIYTYRCDHCGIQFDRRQSFSDKPLVRCPECGKTTLRKLYLPVGIVFKGSGFYATDHRSSSGSISSPSDGKHKTQGKLDGDEESSSGKEEKSEE